MKDIEIKSALEDLEVQPSPRCWQAIESQLAAGVGAAAAAGAAKSVAKAAWISTTAAKITMGAVAALVVAAGVTLAVILPEKSDATAPEVAAVSEKVVVENIDNQTDIPLMTTENVVAENPATAEVDNTIPVQEPATVSAASPTNVAVPTANAVAVSTVPVAAISAPSVTPTASTPVRSSSQETPAKASSQTVKPVVAQTIAQVVEDPVLEQMDFAEETAAPIAIEIPNVMTPNGDGYNDFFVIKGLENCEKSRLLIRNRAGAVVFQVSNYQNNWDAAGLSNGTYYYQLYYTLRGIEQVRTGTLTVLR